MAKSIIKNGLDLLAPSATRAYRRFRDSRAIRFGEPIAVAEDVAIFGEQASSAAYRTRSNEVAALKAGLAACPAFIDVGANVGLFACLARRSGARTVAIEPSARNLQFLFRNIEHNAMPDIEVYPVAVGAAVGIVNLWGSGQGASVKEGWGGISANYGTRVAMNSLDNLGFHRRLPNPLFVKIDVEGAELDVLRGAAELLGAGCVLMIEIGFDENFGGRINPDYAATFEEILRHGYACAAIEARREMTVALARAWQAEGRRGFYALNFLFMPLQMKARFAEFFGDDARA